MFFMKKIIILINIISICMITILSGCKYNTKDTIHTAEGFYFDTFISIKLYGCGSEELALEAVELCGYYEQIFSRTLEESVLSVANAKGELVADTVEKQELYNVIKESITYSEITNGGLDITIKPLSQLWNFGDNNGKVPDEDLIREALEKVNYKNIIIEDNQINFNETELDCGAVAKGYVADRIKDFLLNNEVTSAIINLGGNVQCIGKKPTGEDFVIGVKKPFSEEVMLGLAIDNYSIVTSGVYERYFEVDENKYHHILNPKTGMPCDNGLFSVTIIAESSFTCDALSTGCFVMGLDEAMEVINGMDNVYGIFIDEDYNIYYTEGAQEFVR